MFRLVVILMLAIPAVGALALGPGAITQVEAKTTIHEDGTKTESVKDLIKHQLTEEIYDARKVRIARKVFLLGANGDPTQGTIYDGAGNVVASVKFIFDDLGRVIEERCSNTQGEVFQRVIRQYDASGNALPPKVLNLPVKAPTMRPSTVSYTNIPARGANAKNQPAATPGQIQAVSPATGQVYAPGMPSGGAAAQPVPKKDEKKKGSKLNPFNWFK